MTKKLEDYPNRIREVRLDLGLTQQQLGNAVGMSAVHVGHLELGRRDVLLSKLRAIANALGVTTASLLSARDNPRG